MEEVRLGEKEQIKYKVIKELVNYNENKNRANGKLSISRGQKETIIVTK